MRFLNSAIVLILAVNLPELAGVHNPGILLPILAGVFFILMSESGTALLFLGLPLFYFFGRPTFRGV